MKKTKRILAIIAIVILLGMYLATFLLSFFDMSEGMWMFKASVGSTIILPVLIYAYTLVYRVVKSDSEEEEDENK